MKILIRLTISGFLTLTPVHDSWISRERLTDPLSGEWCCNHLDCHPTEVTETSNGYIVNETKELIPKNRIIWRSPDGWIRCRYLGGEKVGQTRCLIGPPAGS